jgi:hypothetical protein
MWHFGMTWPFDLKKVFFQGATTAPYALVKKPSEVEN